MPRCATPSRATPRAACSTDASRWRALEVLMVGAGGIGCELLKTLVLSGFEDIEMARVRAGSAHLEALAATLCGCR